MMSQHLCLLLETHDGVKKAMELLRDSMIAAKDANLDPWLLATEKDSLLACGCTVAHLRLLTLAELVLHAEETQSPAASVRTFAPATPLIFGLRSCFILSPKGSEVLDAQQKRKGHAVDQRRVAPEENQVNPRPLWDSEARELRVGTRILKRFTRPAPVTELVLSAFQETNWPPYLDDPLPVSRGIVPAERLREAIRRLNRSQSPRMLRFSSNGLGSGMRWEWVARETDQEKPH